MCHKESDDALSCDNCKQPVHAICGESIGEEGYGAKVLCFLCNKENVIRLERDVIKNIKRSAQKMTEVAFKKFKDIEIGSGVLIEVPKVDRGPLDSKNIEGIIMDKKNGLYQIGTTVGIIKD